MFSTLSLALLFAPAAFAAVHDVQVGGPNGELQFYPEAIGAHPGDQVVFHFNPKNHSVVQSSLDSPCAPKEGGVRSEFFAVMANATQESRPTWTITINDTTPFWAYCPQARDTPNFHCGKGMVFSVNCGPDGAPNGFPAFKSAALEIGKQLEAAPMPSADGGYGGGYGAPAPPAEATNTWTAAYGGYTVPPVEEAHLVTQTVTLGEEIWTTSYSSYPGSPAPTPVAAEGQVHRVIVGGSDGLVFNPPSIQAAPRDTVIFEIRAKNHSVTQSSFIDPCRKMQGGFDSELMPVAADSQGPFPTYEVKVNGTEPIWAYCKQRTGNHCGSGMVFAINAVESSPRNFAAFKELAGQMNGTAAGAAADPTNTGAAGGAGNSAVDVKTNVGLTLLLVAGIASLL